MIARRSRVFNAPGRMKPTAQMNPPSVTTDMTDSNVITAATLDTADGLPFRESRHSGSVYAPPARTQIGFYPNGERRYPIR